MSEHGSESAQTGGVVSSSSERVSRHIRIVEGPERWLLDAFCKAGGATKGYQRAGFKVFGVDIEPQPNYCGDGFLQADALDVLAALIEGESSTLWWALPDISAIHASPPCQDHSSLVGVHGPTGTGWLLAATLAMLAQTELPWVCENVVGAGLPNSATLDGRYGIELCMWAFGQESYRHRVFESSLPLKGKPHRPHVTPASKAGHWRPGTFVSVAGNCTPIALARDAMGIDWMTRDELSQSIPPAYTEWIGTQLLTHIEAAASRG